MRKVCYVLWEPWRPLASNHHEYVDIPDRYQITHSFILRIASLLWEVVAATPANRVLCSIWYVLYVSARPMVDFFGVFIMKSIFLLALTLSLISFFALFKTEGSTKNQRFGSAKDFMQQNQRFSRALLYVPQPLSPVPLHKRLLNECWMSFQWREEEPWQGGLESWRRRGRASH